MYVINVYKTHVKCCPSGKVIGDRVPKDRIGGDPKGILCLYVPKLQFPERKQIPA